MVPAYLWKDRTDFDGTFNTTSNLATSSLDLLHPAVFVVVLKVHQPPGAASIQESITLCQEYSNYLTPNFVTEHFHYYKKPIGVI